MSDPTWLEEAEVFFRKGYEAQMQGDLDEAVLHYQRSIELCPTAEAHTFLGWAYSHQGKPEDAIRECQIAIQIDPDFGNPYNDIGAYLIELGRLQEAIPWLKRAMVARRYEPRHYPHMNLGRVYAKQGKLSEAIAELRRALEIEPEYVAARRELHRILGMLN
ncbi:MAG TPA: tetratricopeptide repeat protein [Candidatus Methylomirabilis sp.]|nr:tetratricopeptide repeat protein [Candidatus Methylomirabilis sp.]